MLSTGTILITAPLVTLAATILLPDAIERKIIGLTAVVSVVAGLCKKYELVDESQRKPRASFIDNRARHLYIRDERFAP